MQNCVGWTLFVVVTCCYCFFFCGSLFLCGPWWSYTIFSSLFYNLNGSERFITNLNWGCWLPNFRELVNSSGRQALYENTEALSNFAPRSQPNPTRHEVWFARDCICGLWLADTASSSLFTILCALPAFATLLSTMSTRRIYMYSVYDVYATLKITLFPFYTKGMQPLTCVILFRTTRWTQRLIRYLSPAAPEKRKMVAAEPLWTVRGTLDMAKTNSSWTVQKRTGAWQH